MRDDASKLEIIIECIERIEEFTRDGEQSFFNDNKTQDAVLRNFQVIGDAVKDLSAGFIDLYPNIDWSAFTRFRDKVTHNYEGIDLLRVWDFKETEMRILKTEIEKLHKLHEPE